MGIPCVCPLQEKQGCGEAGYGLRTVSRLLAESMYCSLPECLIKSQLPWPIFSLFAARRILATRPLSTLCRRCPWRERNPSSERHLPTLAPPNTNTHRALRLIHEFGNYDIFTFKQASHIGRENLLKAAQTWLIAMCRSKGIANIKVRQGAS